MRRPSCAVAATLTALVVPAAASASHVRVSPTVLRSDGRAHSIRVALAGRPAATGRIVARLRRGRPHGRSPPRLRRGSRTVATATATARRPLALRHLRLLPGRYVLVVRRGTRTLWRGTVRVEPANLLPHRGVGAGASLPAHTRALVGDEIDQDVNQQA